MLARLSSRNKLCTTSYATADNSIRSNNNNNNNNVPVVDDNDDDDDDEKLVEEAALEAAHVSPAEQSYSGSASRFFSTRAGLRDHQTTDWQLVAANWAHSTGGGVSRAPTDAAATAIPVDGVSSGSVCAGLRATSVASTMGCRRRRHHHNPQLPSSTSLIQNVAPEEPEHYFEEPDTASPRASSSSTTTTTTDHFSFLSSSPPHILTDQQQSSLYHQPQLATAAASLASSSLLRQRDISALGATVGGNSSCNALTSLTEHVDKANRQVLLTLAHSESIAASWCQTLSRMLHNQQQQQLLKGDHRRPIIMSHQDNLQHQQQQQDKSQNQIQQMLIAVQHMSELRNELRAMDNHLFQLISYCLTQGASLEHQSEISVQPSPRSSSQQTSSLPEAQGTATKGFDTTSNPQVAVAQLPVPAESTPSSASLRQPNPEPKRTVNLKKLRLLASTQHLSPPANECSEPLPGKCNEPVRVSCSDAHVSKKLRPSDAPLQPPPPPLSDTHQIPVPPTGYCTTTTTPSTLNSPPYVNHYSIIARNQANTSFQESSRDNRMGPPTKLSCMQPFQSVASGPALYYYPQDASNSLESHDSCCNPQPMLDTGSPTDMSTTTSNNSQHNLLNTTTPRDRHHHHHHHNSHQLSLLSEVPVQALQQRQHTMAFRCHVCGSGFEDKHRLQQHLSIHLSLDPSWFEERTIKETMVRYESKRGDYLCSACGIRHETTAEFDKHMQLHGDKPHQCDLCNQDNKIVSFRYYRQLLTHLRSHCFLYSCRFVSECKQTANRKDYLKLHILKHHLNNKLPDQHIVCCHWKIRKTTSGSN